MVEEHSAPALTPADEHLIACVREGLYDAEIAVRLGWSPKELDLLRLAAMLHDVGKIRVPERILRKDGPLDQAEWEEVRKHAVAGAEIVASVEGLEPIVAWIRQPDFDRTEPANCSARTGRYRSIHCNSPKFAADSSSLVCQRRVDFAEWTFHCANEWRNSSRNCGGSRQQRSTHFCKYFRTERAECTAADDFDLCFEQRAGEFGKVVPLEVRGDVGDEREARGVALRKSVFAEAADLLEHPLRELERDALLNHARDQPVVVLLDPPRASPGGHVAAQLIGLARGVVGRDHRLLRPTPSSPGARLR